MKKSPIYETIEARDFILDLCVDFLFLELLDAALARLWALLIVVVHQELDGLFPASQELLNDSTD